MKKTLFAAALFASLFTASAFAAEGFNVGIDAGTNSAKSVSVGYGFTPAVGVEVAYAHFGDRVGNNFAVTHDTAVSVAAVGTKNVVENLDVFGKVGIANAITHVAAVPGHVASSSSASDYVYGVGVSYRLIAGLSVRAQFEGFSGSTVKSVETVGLTYSF